MIDSITRITLNLQETNTMETIRAKRGDTGRKLLIHLSDGSIPYHISDDCYATFTAKKPDGTKINNACTIENNVIEYEFTDQTCTAVGTMKAEIRLYGADDKMITSACFLVNVYDTVFRDGDEVGSETEMNTLDDLILRANAFLNETGKLLRWQGNWDSETEYEANDLVLHEEVLYVAEEAIAAGTVPGSEGAAWVPIAGMGTGSGGEVVGIASVKQTTTTSTSGGVNVVTVTLTDGSESEIKIRNGQNGMSIQGPAGDDYVLTDADKAEIAEMAAGLVEVPDSDLTSYATEQWVKDQKYLTEVPEGYAKNEDIPTKPEDIGAQPSGNYALKSEIPSVPVQSVNGKTGTVQLSAADVGARSDNWMPSAQEVGALPNTYTPPNQTAEQVGADPKGTAASAVSQHNTADDSHNDIRLELKAINDRLTAFFDSDNQTLDELSEIVAYITSNKSLIDSITTSKVSVAEIINNLTTNVSNKPLSAAQGVVLKGLIDTVSGNLANYQPKGDYVLRSELPIIPTKVSAFTNDAGYLTEHQDISGKLDTDMLPEAINDALAQAKASGAFDGEDGQDGYTPQKGVDYFDGQDGKDGVSPTVDVSKSGKVTTITITDANGMKTATINDGEDGSNAESYTIPDFWTNALNTAIATVKSLQTGKNCVTFAHFSDNHTRLGYSGALIAEAMKKCNIPFCFYNGDSISSGYISTEAEMIAQEEAFEAMISVIPNNQFCRSLGNHDGYWAVSADERYTYTRDQNYELFFRKQATTQNKQFGNDGTYFFVEDLASKVRFIVLNSNGGSVDDTQLAWFRDIALKVDEGWAVVVISHQPISNHYHSGISNAADVRAIVTESGVEMIGWFSGHVHRDRIYTGAATNTTDDTVGADMGFKQVTITSDDTSIAYDSATQHPIAEDTQSHAIDFVTINRDTQTVNLTRLGIGNNRVYSYDNIILYSITNNLQNVVSNNTTQSVEAGSGYTANLTVLSGYENLTVTVTMGGVDITSTAYSNGVITIEEVTGDVVITAMAEESAEPAVNIWQAPYKLNSRLNTSETDPATNGAFISAWYPVSQEQLSGDIVLRSNMDIFNYANRSGGGDYIRFYPSAAANTKLLSGLLNTNSYCTREFDAETGIYSLTIKYAWFKEVSASEIKYFRWCAQVSTSAITADYFDGCILTINQPIA